MTGYLMYMVARAHGNDLLREAEASRRACPLPPPPRRKFALPRPAIRRTSRAATVGT